MQLIMQSVTVIKISVELCHRNQIKLIVSLTVFEKFASIWNFIWFKFYVSCSDLTQSDNQSKAIVQLN